MGQSREELQVPLRTPKAANILL